MTPPRGDPRGRRDPLAEFPFITKQNLRQNHLFGMFAVPQEQLSRIHAYSGTTGRPTVVGYRPRTSRRGRGMARSIRGAARHVKGSIGLSVGVEVLDPGAIERSVGKMRRIVDERRT